MKQMAKSPIKQEGKQRNCLKCSLTSLSIWLWSCFSWSSFFRLSSSCFTLLRSSSRFPLSFSFRASASCCCRSCASFFCRCSSPCLKNRSEDLNLHGPIVAASRPHRSFHKLTARLPPAPAFCLPVLSELEPDAFALPVTW